MGRGAMCKRRRTPSGSAPVAFNISPPKPDIYRTPAELAQIVGEETEDTNGKAMKGMPLQSRL
jgi:hypothetical protein